MFPVEAFSNTACKFVEIAHSLELPFHLTGGSISSAYGEPRLTQDIDIVISPDIAKQPPLPRSSPPRFFRDALVGHLKTTT